MTEFSVLPVIMKDQKVFAIFSALKIIILLFFGRWRKPEFVNHS